MCTVAVIFYKMTIPNSIPSHDTINVIVLIYDDVYSKHSINTAMMKNYMTEYKSHDFIKQRKIPAQESLSKDELIYNRSKEPTSLFFNMKLFKLTHQILLHRHSCWGASCFQRGNSAPTNFESTNVICSIGLENHS